MWVGPYLITKSLGKGFYELQSCGKGPVTTIPRVSHVHIKVYKSLSCSPSRKLQSPSASNESPSTPSNITHPVLSTDSSTQPVSSIILQSSSASSDTLFCPSPGRDSPTFGASPSRSAVSLSPTKDETTLTLSLSYCKGFSICCTARK